MICSLSLFLSLCISLGPFHFFSSSGCRAVLLWDLLGSLAFGFLEAFLLCLSAVLLYLYPYCESNLFLKIVWDLYLDLYISG